MPGTVILNAGEVKWMLVFGNTLPEALPRSAGISLSRKLLLILLRSQNDRQLLFQAVQVLLDRWDPGKLFIEKVVDDVDHLGPGSASMS